NPKQAINIKNVTHLCLNKNLKELPYLLVIALNELLNAAKKRCIKLRFTPAFSSCCLSNMAHNARLNVKAFTAEIAIATIKVTPNCVENTPVRPLIKVTGINTAHITNVIELI